MSAVTIKAVFTHRLVKFSSRDMAHCAEGINHILRHFSRVEYAGVISDVLAAGAMTNLAACIVKRRILVKEDRLMAVSIDLYLLTISLQN